MYPPKLFQFLLHFSLLQLIYFDEREITFKKILTTDIQLPFQKYSTYFNEEIFTTRYIPVQRFLSYDKPLQNHNNQISLL